MRLEQVITKDLTRYESDIYVFRGIPLTTEGHTRETRSDGAALAANTHVVHKELFRILIRDFLPLYKTQWLLLWECLILRIGLRTMCHCFTPTSVLSLRRRALMLMRQHWNGLTWRGMSADCKQLISLLWQSVLCQDSVSSRFRNILLVVPINSAECERGFSLMGHVKCDWKSRLKPDTLSELMSINLCNTDYKEYDPEEAILIWLRSGKLPRRFAKASGCCMGIRRWTKLTFHCVAQYEILCILNSVSAGNTLGHMDWEHIFFFLTISNPVYPSLCWERSTLNFQILSLWKMQMFGKIYYNLNWETRPQEQPQSIQTGPTVNWDCQVLGVVVFMFCLCNCRYNCGKTL